ncbi:unnamed protein product [Musa acuminata subsp. malaccensis]|uniref:(wild Malaysian banana) hypothetical protein n=1 Tax=Musa acuminata subsp. malaccensis TaxID=214687 RepID=A0A804HQW0_MUSAM|nr:unnamed protein product [Musa acuminata subsp. malaccensis]
MINRPSKISYDELIILNFLGANMIFPNLEECICKIFIK